VRQAQFIAPRLNLEKLEEALRDAGYEQRVRTENETRYSRGGGYTARIFPARSKATDRGPARSAHVVFYCPGPNNLEDLEPFKAAAYDTEGSAEGDDRSATDGPGGGHHSSGSSAAASGAAPPSSGASDPASGPEAGTEASPRTEASSRGHHRRSLPDSNN